jgi:hypothetical protein
MRIPSCLAVPVCGLLLALSGCVAAPLAQMAVSQMSPAMLPCTTNCQGNQPVSLNALASSINSTFGRFAGSETVAPPADQPLPR